MSPPTGRPRSDNPKDIMIRVRMDKETVERLDECVEALQTTRSEVIRCGIKKVEADIVKRREK